MKRRWALGFVLANGVALAITHDQLRRAHEVADLKSGLGDVQAALHFEGVAALAFVIALMSAFCAVAVVLRDPINERLLIALGATAAIGVTLWVWMFWWF